MKKILSLLLVTILIMTSFILSSCDTKMPAYKKIIARDETDGQFYYYYMENLDGYTIVGDMEENNPEVMYLPAYYKGKEVKRVFYTTTLGAFSMQTKTFGPSFFNVKKIYIPFTCPKNNYYKDSSESLYKVFTDSRYRVKEVFSPCVGLDYEDAWEIFSDTIFDYGYGKITFYFYNKYFDKFKEKEEAIRKEHGEETFMFLFDEYVDRLKFYRTSSGSQAYEIVKANTVYMFNYEDSSNGGVFAVDNYSYGGQIDEYWDMPLRDGFTFMGWYKEPKCKNKWDFENDKLPAVEYDEEGNPTEFIETKLYAGWQKI